MRGDVGVATVVCDGDARLVTDASSRGARRVVVGRACAACRRECAVVAVAGKREETFVVGHHQRSSVCGDGEVGDAVRGGRVRAVTQPVGRTPGVGGVLLVDDVLGRVECDTPGLVDPAFAEAERAQNRLLFVVVVSGDIDVTPVR